MSSFSIDRRDIIRGGAALGIGIGVAAMVATPARAAPSGRATATVMDFGAVGDGVTDDSAAFSVALGYAASHGQMVAVPGLIYAINHPIAWTS